MQQCTHSRPRTVSLQAEVLAQAHHLLPQLVAGNVVHRHSPSHCVCCAPQSDQAGAFGWLHAAVIAQLHQLRRICPLAVPAWLAGWHLQGLITANAQAGVPCHLDGTIQPGTSARGAVERDLPAPPRFLFEGGRASRLPLELHALASGLHAQPSCT